MTRFLWTFLVINIAVGVVTALVQQFQFGGLVGLLSVRRQRGGRAG